MKKIHRWKEPIGYVSGSIASLFATVVSTPVLAQTAPSRQEVEIGKPDKETMPKAQVSVESREATQSGPCPLRESTIRVDLKSVTFSGPGGEDIPAEFKPLLAGIGSGSMGNQPVSVVCDIRDTAVTALRSRGYIASVQIPSQEIATGELKLEVVSARITSVRVRGDADRFREMLRPRIAELQSLYPLNERDVERVLLLADDIPGLDVRMSLRAAGTKPGEVIGDLAVSANRGTLLLNLQNSGSRQLGRELGTVRGELYGLAGMGDVTYLSLSNSFDWKEQHIAQFGHETGIGGSGLRFGTRLSYAQSRPSVRNLLLRSRSLIAGFDLSYPLVRRVNTSLSATTGFEYINQTTRIGTGVGAAALLSPFTRDRVRVGFARLDGTTGERNPAGERKWSVEGYLEYRQGLDVFNASKRNLIVNGFSPSRFDGNAKASVVRGELDATAKIARNVTMRAMAYGQWSSSPLLNIEEFSLGNLTYGRGFDPGSNGADRVVAFRLEPRARLTEGQKLALEIMAFYDNVRIWNRDAGSIENRRTLDSVGGGIRLVLPNRMLLDLTYAKPLTKALLTDRQSPTERLLVTLTTKLLPWRAGR